MTQPMPVTPRQWTFPNPDGSTSVFSYGWDPAPAVPPMLVGSNRKPLDLTRYPKLAYMRLFGAVGKGIPSVVGLPAGVTPHVSFKDQPTVALVDPWLAALDRDVYLTWHHEPEGDLTPDAYHAGWAALSALVDGAPGSSPRVTLVEVFTLYAQTHGKTPWTDLWSGKADMIAFDSYNTVVAKTDYPAPTDFFRLPCTAAHNAGVPLLIPELGTRLALDDTAGYGAAAWYRDCADYLRGQGCRAVAAWDQMGANAVDWTLVGKPLAAWQAVVAGQ